MRKFFSFGSSATSNAKDKVGTPPPSPTDKQAYSEHALKTKLKSEVVDNIKAQKQTHKNKSSSTGPYLQRSRSLSSAAFLDVGQALGDENRSPSYRNNSASHQHCDPSSRYQILIPEGHYDAKQYEIANFQHIARLERPGSSASSRNHYVSSGNSSTCSSNVSTKIVDRYVDGEQQQSFSSQRHYTTDRNGRRRPPRVQSTAPTSPTNSIKDKPGSHSFRSSDDEWPQNGRGHESPRSLAKNVIERLSQSYLYPKSNLETDSNVPITIGDVYGRSTKQGFDPNLFTNDVAQKVSSRNEYHETANDYFPKDCSGFDRQNHDCEGFSHVKVDDGIDKDLFRRAAEAEERVVFLYKDLDQENFLQESGFTVPGLIQTIKNLMKERISLALEVSGMLQSQIADRACFKEKLRVAKVELESQTRKLEKEKNELQLGLEKELDRRSNDWSCKLEKYQFEEQRLRERVRELAEQNVSFQKEFSSFNARETENRRLASYSEQTLKDLTASSDALRVENQNLKENLSELQEYGRAAKEDSNRLKRSLEEKEIECKELQRSITRLCRTCSEQERTINGLLERFSDDIWKNKSEGKLDENVAKLQMEIIRLTRVELGLRRELESYGADVDSLRHENTNMLNHLKDSGKDIGALTLKLDKELTSRIYCLQHQGISLLIESSQFCSKLWEFIKEKSRLSEPNQAMEVMKNGLDCQFVIESEMKIQGLKRGTESLTRSLQMVSTVMHEKSNQVRSCGSDTDGSNHQSDGRSEHNLRSELKAEALLTSLLREKLYSKELEVEQLHAELATAVRGSDILRSELRNAVDTISTITHRLKDLELQMSKKDENVTRLEIELKESTEEVAIARGMMPQISKERNLMRDEARQYGEENTRLSTEVGLLRKKIEALEEEVLLKEGQITILKDTITNKPFDLFANPDSPEEFLLK